MAAALDARHHVKLRAEALGLDVKKFEALKIGEADQKDAAAELLKKEASYLNTKKVCDRIALICAVIAAALLIATIAAGMIMVVAAGVALGLAGIVKLIPMCKDMAQNGRLKKECAAEKKAKSEG
jgi:predicted phage tail protein